MSNEKIRVGIIGVGGWAKYGHIPALQYLEDFEIIAVSSRKKETAEEYAAKFNILHAFGDEQALINHPDVDIVVILAPAPEHARYAKAAIAAGKDVYSEWPLTTKTSESEELLSLAEAKGVRHIVGLQRRLGASARYTRDLVKQGYVGKIRSARMTVSVDAFMPTMPGRYEWAFHASNFSHVLSIYGGHFMDMLFQSVGFPKKLTAVVENQFPFFTVEETGEKIPTTNPNEVMVIGTLEDGGLFSVQLEGGQRHRTGLQIDITGTEGVLKVTNPRAFENKEDNSIEGVNGDGSSLSPLPVPAEYQSLANSHLDASVLDVAYLYAAYARDRKNGTSEASNFRDAVRQHQLIDQIVQTSETFFK
ncbi:Gfo/Idh/MocA family oxidoreductase [Nostoc sp. NMS8]|uniref:Gfo/Idh/MocA family protein n=1 Tax=Nostoc sp. NMS8 TaxID=2815392 RepID=UPI0025E5BA09|nr:Gfo/Idh/MocA family oxidoreductase [Nostoc sp. NMS8]MBN3958053.1 Gfo/Idh/MocA family oxidoreductase [Nostoc sp. NMS8]